MSPALRAFIDAVREAAKDNGHQPAHIA